jgi:hypothetical protein
MQPFFYVSMQTQFLDLNHPIPSSWAAQAKTKYRRAMEKKKLFSTFIEADFYPKLIYDLTF